MENESDEYKKSIARGTNNLYAIVIDTNWYNWFPQEFGLAENNYQVIYNEALYDKDIFESLIPNRIKADLSYQF